MNDEVVTTPFGKFLVNPAECIGGTVKAGTVWDGPGFLQVLAKEYGRLGEPGIAILDVGAHLGDWTVWLASKGAWRVVAVEPAPVMIDYLKANLDLNKSTCAESVVLLPIAAYDRSTTLQWTEPYSANDSGGAALTPDGTPITEGNSRSVPARRLDDYAYLFGDRVSLIKIDAQGCDGATIVGLTKTIEKDHPVIIFEWEERLAPPHGYTLQDVYGWLEARGYVVQEWPSHLHNYVALPELFML
jgi:FkbM family methyltransferase